MKVDLSVQGHFWATIIIPDDSLLALLARGMITEATPKLNELTRALADLSQIQCSISLPVRPTFTYAPFKSIPKLPDHRP